MVLSLPACGPNKKTPQKKFIEVVVTEEGLVADLTKSSNHLVEGNIWIENLEKAWSGERSSYTQASFFEAAKSNILFSEHPPYLFEPRMVTESAQPAAPQ